MIAVDVAELLSRKRLLIFDLDGTIVDSSPLHERAFNDAFAGEGITVDYPAIAGMTTEAAVDEVAGKAGLRLAIPRRLAIIEAKRARARHLIETELKPIHGSVDFIRRARAGFPMALCTSGSRATVEVALAGVGLAGMFEPVIAAEDVVRGKPDPEGFLKGLEFHGATVADALVFEDSESGLVAARLAGIEAVQIVPIADASAPGQADWAVLNAALARLHP